MRGGWVRGRGHGEVPLAAQRVPVREELQQRGPEQRAARAVGAARTSPPQPLEQAFANLQMSQKSMDNHSRVAH